MTISLNRLAYQFDNDGNTSSVSVGLNGSDSGDAVSATLQIISSDLATGKTFDDMTKADFETLAKAKLANLTAVKSA
ncbi:hypothetical protein [Liquorilactobacillus nagelii]|uniref:hypothetical protein n=1 Tax=Liquorilactobacillus nagelii TaxID=82688 RepID=UPI0006EFDAE7|nr:hypothetical protein [Liquorilactobacillus nagelii]KRL39929.1 hypothetical protein FD45_GL000105 [Liquorilactobacillus nagelii DSM 13675]QYH53445.1 hypothetical protein G6O73_01530 [Liquorilactobacillus nagelii DSM 13675]